MTDKSTIRKNIYRLNQLKIWQLLVLFLIVAFIAGTFLRLNNVGMVERRTAVLAADKSGDKQQITERLYDLQRYSAAHMNSNTGPFYLEHQYQRDTQAILQQAGDDTNPNGNVYARADAICKPRFGQVYSLAYQQCMLTEIDKFPAADNPDTEVKLPEPNMYRYDFASPLISIDFAGLATGVCLAILGVILLRGATLGLLKSMLKRNYRGI